MADQEVYGRAYSLVVGAVETLPVEEWAGDSGAAADFPVVAYHPSDIVLKGEESTKEVKEDKLTVSAFIEFTDLQMTADVGSHKDSKHANNTAATIKIWNLNKKDRDFIKEEFTVILRAGYVQDLVGQKSDDLYEKDGLTGKRKEGSKDLPLLFVGDIISVTTEGNLPDQVTTMTCKDSAYSFRGLRVSESYPPKTTYRQVLEDLINKATLFGIKFGGFNEADIDTEVLDKELPTGFTAYGRLLEEIQRVCNNIQYKAYMSLGSLFVESEKTPTKKPVIEISSDKLLYYIRPHRDGSNKSHGGKAEINGVEISMPLDARYTVSKDIKIKEGEYKGSREITSIAFKLDYEGKDWDTRLRAVSK